MLTDELRALAAHLGVATDYHDWQGRPVEVPVETVVAVLAALGVTGELSDPDQARAALERAHADDWRDVLPPCTVVREGTWERLPVHLTHGDEVEVLVDLEGGGRRALAQVEWWVAPIEVDGRLVGEASFALPTDLPLGYHRLSARLRPGDREVGAGTLVVTPSWIGMPDAARGGVAAGGSDGAASSPEDDAAPAPLVGTMVQLYGLRSRRSWGLGDLADLGDLAAWSVGAMAADFVLVNPLHAAEPVAPMEPSPYLPASRRFANPVYLRVEDVPEWGYLSGPDREIAERIAVEGRALTAGDRLDRDAVWELKGAALELVHAVERGPARQAAYEAFLEREGQGLVDFGTWCALVEQHGPRWSHWPAELQDPGSAVVAAACETLDDRIDFHCWLQWLLDEQLEAVQRQSAALGMGLGIVHDLAVGVHPDGADAWAQQDVFASGISVGAPADAFNQQGQDWSQPPWRPDVLARTSYAAYRDLVRSLLRHAGGVRIDHVIGLFRLWWVPDGLTPDKGTYVRYDHEALVGILALEATRAGAVVVGEDLGTVEPWVRDYLRHRGILGTSILWFERDWDHGGAPRAPETWRELCLATVTTHDLPPTWGYLDGEHIRVRDALGLLTRPVEEERAVDERERAEWLEVLVAHGLLEPGGDDHDAVVALHRYLRRTPARMLGVSVADLVGERRTINQPGTDDEYPNWLLPLTDGAGRPVLLDDLADHAVATALAAAVRTD